MGTSGGRRPALRRIARARGERGFTLIETVIAIGTIFVALTALAFTATAGFRYIGLSREQQAANQLADKLMEDIRGLSFDRVALGLSATDAAAEAADPEGNIEDCGGGVYRFQTCTPPTQTSPPGVGEVVIAKASDVVVEPLTPNTGVVGRAQGYPTDYTWHTYVTNENPDELPYRVTVIVSWTVGTVSRQVQTQSLFAQAKGSSTCDPSTHPFSAPCQPFFYGTASVTQGSIAVAPTGAGFPGTTFQSGSLSLTSVGSDLQQEQLVRVQGSLRQTGVSLTDAAVSVGDGDGVASAADNDPSGQAPAYSDTGLFTGTQFTRTSGAGPSITFSNTAGDTGQSVSAAQAAAGSPCPPPATGGTPQTDGLGCGGSYVRQAGPLESSATLSTVGEVSIVRVQGVGASDMNTSFVDRIPVTGQDGDLESTASRVLGDVGIGGFPTGAEAPAGWGGYLLRLEGYSDTASAFAGTSAPGPSAQVLGGTISFWNGTGYEGVSVTAGGTLPTMSATSVDGTVVVSLIPQEPTVQAVVATSGDGSQGDTEPSPNESSASVTAPLSGQYEYVVAVNGLVVLDVTIGIDLGSVVARSSYAPAPGVSPSPSPSP
ncbi:MAG: hypothetical protein ACE14W_00355 [Candidatus Velamenicoccus archaeovorus]